MCEVLFSFAILVQSNSLSSVEPFTLSPARALLKAGNGVRLERERRGSSTDYPRHRIGYPSDYECELDAVRGVGMGRLLLVSVKNAIVECLTDYTLNVRMSISQ